MSRAIHPTISLESMIQQSGGDTPEEVSPTSSGMMTASRGTPQWMAPELCGVEVEIRRKTLALKSDPRGFSVAKTSLSQYLVDNQEVKYGMKVDVYSFAVLLWEIAMHESPWANTPHHQVFLGVVQGERPRLPGEKVRAPTGWFELVEECWAQHPDSRPSFNSILDKLKQIELDFHPGHNLAMPDRERAASLATGVSQRMTRRRMVSPAHTAVRVSAPVSFDEMSTSEGYLLGQSPILEETYYDIRMTNFT